MHEQESVCKRMEQTMQNWRCLYAWQHTYSSHTHWVRLLTRLKMSKALDSTQLQEQTVTG